MEFPRSSKRNQIDYDDEAELNWPQYLDQNLVFFDHDSPFPDSSWHYTQGDSVFEKKDRALRREVLEKIFESSEVDGSEISVDVLNGHILLSGGVESEAEIEKATELIQELPDALEVANDLHLL